MLCKHLHFLFFLSIHPQSVCLTRSVYTSSYVSDPNTYWQPTNCFRTRQWGALPESPFLNGVQMAGLAQIKIFTKKMQTKFIPKTTRIKCVCEGGLIVIIGLFPCNLLFYYLNRLVEMTYSLLWILPAFIGIQHCWFKMTAYSRLQFNRRCWFDLTEIIDASAAHLWQWGTVTAVIASVKLLKL